MTERGDSGLIIVDALVAVVIVSLMIAVCLSTLKFTRTMAQTADDNRDAALVLAAVIDAVPRKPGHYRGISGRFTYRVEVLDGRVQDISVCRIEASANVKSRTYRLNGTRWCTQSAS